MTRERAGTPALLSFEIRKWSNEWRWNVGLREIFFFLTKVDSFSLSFFYFFFPQKLTTISDESFKSNLWHVVGAFVFFSFSLLSQGFSKLKLRFHDLVKLTWMWSWRCKDISSTPGCMFPPVTLCYRYGLVWGTGQGPICLNNFLPLLSQVRFGDELSWSCSLEQFIC